ncbi:hypothetical protein DPMN_155430 [Dreissena polymorpha]|uniref:Uncharacterized protein n=1 Tax=Dreissena polymorpha TaxID=45954 RepID=A0A9D4JAW5_DREPO|nr:hypothetical protein DPMN_155430 [Dreissena polymorpha]
MFYLRTSNVGRGVLMQLLRNLQNNAAALERMALGLSEETNIEERVCHIAANSQQMISEEAKINI